MTTNLANQRPIKVRCTCGWEGMAPEGLVAIMGTGEMACPGCYKMFAGYPWPPKDKQH